MSRMKKILGIIGLTLTLALATPILALNPGQCTTDHGNMTCTVDKSLTQDGTLSINVPGSGKGSFYVQLNITANGTAPANTNVTYKIQDQNPYSLSGTNTSGNLTIAWSTADATYDNITGGFDIASGNSAFENITYKLKVESSELRDEEETKAGYDYYYYTYLVNNTASNQSVSTEMTFNDLEDVDEAEDEDISTYWDDSEVTWSWTNSYIKFTRTVGSPHEADIDYKIGIKKPPKLAWYQTTQGKFGMFMVFLAVILGLIYVTTRG